MKKLQIAVGIIRNENNEIFRVEFYSDSKSAESGRTFDSDVGASC